MKLNFKQISEAYTAIQNLSENKLPFKLSFLLSRNLLSLKKEFDFYIIQERNFIVDYLVLDNNGQALRNEDGSFQIQEGKYEECLKARQVLDSFESEVEISKLPISLLEPLEITPTDLAAINFMIEEEEEHE